MHVIFRRSHYVFIVAINLDGLNVFEKILQHLFAIRRLKIFRTVKTMFLDLPYDLLYKVVDHSLVDVFVKKNLSGTCDYIRNLVYQIILERANMLYTKSNLWIHYNNLDLFTVCTQPNMTLKSVLNNMNIHTTGLKCYIMGDLKIPVHLNVDISSLAMKFIKHQLMICVTENKKKKKQKKKDGI